MADETRGAIDSARAVRAGEELDEARLRAYLTEVLPLAGGDLEVEQFPRGHSNLTYLLRVGDRELVLRRPPFGAKIKSAHDMGREYRILAALEGVYPRAPKPLAYCDDEAVLGAPFYLMERVRGVILRGANPPAALSLGPDEMGALSTALVDALGDLHAVDIERCGLAGEGKNEGYVARQVRGWTARYHKAQTDDVADIERVAAWLDGHQPLETGAVLVHNDFKYDNVVLAPDALTRVVALLDWEMATVGDPWLDVGTSLGYWIDPDDFDDMKLIALGPTLREGGLRRKDFVERYVAVSGRATDDIVFYYAFGLFKIAVIAQQIYKRFKDGHTKDARFGMMIMGVRLLGQQAARAIDKERIFALG